MANKNPKPIKHFKEHISIDLYYQALKISQELDDMLLYISTRKKHLDLIVKRFQYLHQLDTNNKPRTESEQIVTNAYNIAKETKKYQKWLRKNQKENLCL